MSTPTFLKTTLSELVAQYGLEAVQKELNNRPNPDIDEPILNPANKKYTMFPIEYPSIFELYNKQKACMWTAEEIDFSNDYEDFSTLKPEEQFFIEQILAFFAASDGIVNFNLSERFLQDVQITEALTAYTFQMMMENIHSHVYSLMLENIVRDSAKRTKLFKAIETVPSVKMMADWAFKWIDSSENFAQRVIAFAMVEGIFFSGAFAAIFWIKKTLNRNNNKSHLFMNGLVSSNKLISRDEGLHVAFACEIYKHLNKKLDASTVNNIVREATNISQNFMTDALPVRMIGMNSSLMNQYIEYIADRLLMMLGYGKIYNKENPFKFMEEIGLDDKSNFFEVRPTEYQNPHVMNSSGKSLVIQEDDF